MDESKRARPTAVRQGPAGRRPVVAPFGPRPGGNIDKVNLGRYEVVRELGKGAMGIVYLARDPVIGRLVALKTIRLAEGGDEDEVREFQQRFVREAQAAGILSHPSIVTVHDIGQEETKGVSFIAMEYVEGPTLKEIIQQGKPLPYSDLALILSHVADALDYAHTKGIVHRDVKPANIILCGQHKVKITDFGIAKIASEAANLTTTGQFLGTPNYMAPEQVKGTKVDGRTDIFSLGIVLYECLTRRKPFGGDSLTTISYRIVHEPFESPHEVDASIPIVFDEVVNRCLAKDPKDRYSRARDVAGALRAIAAGQPLPPPSTEPAIDPTVIGGGHIPTLETPFPDAGAAGAGAGGAPAKVKRETRFDQAMKRRIHPAAFFAIVVLLLAAVAGAGAWIWSQRVEVPRVDAEREAMVLRQRQLRTEGRQLLEQGNVEGAYQRFRELQRLAPGSPEVTAMLARLETIRGERESVQQRRAASLLKLEEGRKLYAAREYEKAIPIFEEAFNLDPSATDAVNYLSMSREQLALRQMREAEKIASATVREGIPVGTGAATLSIDYTGPLEDGYTMVTLDGEKIVHENFYDARGMLRRRTPREVNIQREIPPGRHQLIVWAILPASNRRTVTAREVFDLNVRAGTQYRVAIRWNSAANQFEITLK